MTKFMRFAACLGFIVPFVSAQMAFANDKISEAEGMIERAAELRAEADALAEKAAALIKAAEAEAAAAKEESETAEAATEDGASEATLEGAEGDNIAAAYEEGGKYFTADDVPTFNVAANGEVDWNTFSGFRRYHSECHVCHGPDGEGSTYAPALKKSALDMDYYDFVDVVVNGRKVVGSSANSVMPSFGENKNVMCYLDDIYVYLKARGTEDVARGRPGKKAKKTAEYKEQENACMEG